MFRCFLFIILVIIAYYDAKTLEINDKFLTLFFGTTIVFTSSKTILENLPSAAMIWFLFAISALFSSLFGRDVPIGMGDIKLLSIMCLNLGGLPVALIFAAAGFLSGIYAAVLLVLKKAGRGSEIPFAPFIAAGFGIYAFLV